MNFVGYSTNCSSGTFHHVGFSRGGVDGMYERAWEKYAEGEPECSGDCSDCPVLDCENNESEETE